VISVKKMQLQGWAILPLGMVVATMNALARLITKVYQRVDGFIRKLLSFRHEHRGFA